MCLTEATCVSHTIENFLLHGSNFKKLLSFCSCLDVFSKWFVMYMSLWFFKVIYTSFIHSVKKIQNSTLYILRIVCSKTCFSFDIKKSHLGFESTFFMSWKKNYFLISTFLYLNKICETNCYFKTQATKKLKVAKYSFFFNFAT